MAERVSAAEFAAFLQERVGEGCISGAAGQDALSLPEWYFSGQYAGQELDAALAWRRKGNRVWGGMGLAEGFFRQKTGEFLSARPAWAFRDWCDPRGCGCIPPEYRLPGAALFRGDHAAAFLTEPVNPADPGGDWYAVGANDVRRGVERMRLLSGEWDRWGLLSRLFLYASPAEAMELPLGARLLKQGCTGRDVYQLQRLMGRMGWQTAPDGYFGPATAAVLRRMQAALDIRADGEYGMESHIALMARMNGGADGRPETKALDIRRETAVRHLPCEGGRCIGMLFPGMQAEWIGEGSGWTGIRFCGGTGWIPGDSCEVIKWKNRA